MGVYKKTQIIHGGKIKVDIETIQECIRKITTDKRFLHSKGVEKTAVLLARHYGVDETKARYAGLMHDCVKNLPAEEMFSLCEKFGCKLDWVEQAEPKLIHGPLGAFYSKNVFGIDDDEIFDAIYYHTTAKADMSMLTKIIYIADLIEPNRNFSDVEKLRELAFSNIDSAILKSINFTIKKIVDSGRMLHSETINARNYLISKGVTV